MSSSKVIKMEAEIEKVKAKISEYQARLKELEQKKTEFENTEIVDMVRGVNIPLDELAALLQKLRGKDGGPAAKAQKTAPAPILNEKKEGTEE